MTAWHGFWTIVRLDLQQRVRSTAWYVLLGVFVLLTAAVTGLVWLAAGNLPEVGSAIHSYVIVFVLLLGTLVSPALSGNAINGERDGGTLATTQVTLVSTWQIVLGKFVAAWITALAFLATAVPFLLFAGIVGGLRADAVVISILVLAAELAVIAAIGVGLSGVIAKPLFSVATTYLVVAALSIGTLIAFGLAGAATQTMQRHVVTSVDWSGQIDLETGMPEQLRCLETEEYTYPVPRFDLYWGFLAANPYVVLADAVPAQFDRNGYPVDLFAMIKVGVRQAQIAPEPISVFDECAMLKGNPDDPWANTGPTPEEVVDSTVPSWFVGLAVHALIAAGALGWAVARTRTPARRLTAGTRVA